MPPARAAAYDPVAVVDAVLRLLARQGVPVAVHSLDQAIEGAVRLLGDLGVEAGEPGVERGEDDAFWRKYEDATQAATRRPGGGRIPTQRRHLSVVRP